MAKHAKLIENRANLLQNGATLARNRANTSENGAKLIYHSKDS
jgi:hypothetical protein